MTEETNPSNTNEKENTKNVALLAQLSVFSCFVGVPFGSILGPLIVKMMNEQKHPDLKNFMNELINFQLSILIYSVVSGILCLAFIGFLLLPVVGILWLIFTVIGLSKVCNYEYGYKYPMPIRMIK